MNKMHLYPWLSLLLAAVVSMHCPGHRISSIALSHNIKTPVHKDSNNHPRVPSLILPVSDFQHGQLWIDDLTGSVRRLRAGIMGTLKPRTVAISSVNSRLARATEAWMGDRTVLLVYHVRDGWKMEPKDAELLSLRGFQFWTGDAEIDPYLLVEES